METYQEYLARGGVVFRSTQWYPNRDDLQLHPVHNGELEKPYHSTRDTYSIQEPNFTYEAYAILWRILCRGGAKGKGGLKGVIVKKAHITQENRLEGVRLVREEGYSELQVSDKYNVDRATVICWLRKY